MIRRFWVVFVLILCVFFVFFFIPFGEEAEQLTDRENQNSPLSDDKTVQSLSIE